MIQLGMYLGFQKVGDAFVYVLISTEFSGIGDVSCQPSVVVVLQPVFS